MQLFIEIFKRKNAVASSLYISPEITYSPKWCVDVYVGSEIWENVRKKSENEPDCQIYLG